VNSDSRKIIDPSTKMEMLKTALEAKKKVSENFEDLNTKKKYGL